MKTKIIITGIIAGTLALGGTAYFGADKNDISKEKFKDKYDTSIDLKEKYTIDGTSLKRNVKDDPKDMVRVEIGNKDDADFTPKLKISRWDEVDFSITPKGLDKVEAKDKTLTFDKEKIKLGTPKVDYILYEMPASEANPEGAYEYQIDLKEDPRPTKTGDYKIEFDLVANGLDFFYQPALTQQEIDDGAFRPENVIGSYAIYAKTPKTNWTGGKEYKTGKIGHIFRPKIIDSVGTEVWGDLHIESVNGVGILSVTIPQDFLDKAVYPVRHASGLAFGYETLGGSLVSIETFTGSLFTGVAGTGVSMSMGLSYSGATQTTYEGNIYVHSDSSKLANGKTNQGTIVSFAKNWKTQNFTSTPTFTAVDYLLMAWYTRAAFEQVYLYYDAGSADQGHVDNSGATYNTWPDPGTFTSHNTNKYSIYATYTASGASDSCTYTSGDWNILGSDHCYITGDTYVTGACNLIGAGYMDLVGTISCGTLNGATGFSVNGLNGSAIIYTR